jgi:hypothetical protein
VTFLITARRWILRLAILAAVAAAVLVYAIVRNGFPSGGKAVLAVIGIVAATAPPLVLSALWVALGELLRLPERLQRLPLEARQHGEQLRELFGRARAASGSRFRLARVFWQLTRTTASARDTLTRYAPLLPLASAPFLAASVVAAFFATVEILIACIVAIVLATG